MMEKIWEKLALPPKSTDKRYSTKLKRKKAAKAAGKKKSISEKICKKTCF
jgi:hypothetical protein